MREGYARLESHANIRQSKHLKNVRLQSPRCVRLGKGPGKRGHVVADTLLLMRFQTQTRGTPNECYVSMLRKLGHI